MEEPESLAQISDSNPKGHRPSSNLMNVFVEEWMWTEAMFNTEKLSSKNGDCNRLAAKERLTCWEKGNLCCHFIAMVICILNLGLGWSNRRSSAGLRFGHDSRAHPQ